ncbi:MAG: hypothetical protein P8I51_05030 [Polaribacter sp.]|jgi:hypothetical protein|nr:hypothetical protein [Polaribacter sp.]MDG1954244.1 hypothetical protein [Polaribacter sp.]MDG2073067.1 hypothetical protein [Polaribacter sp.]
MKFVKKIGTLNLAVLFVCLVIVIYAEYLFLSGDKLHGIFLGLWAPMLIGLLIFFNTIMNGDR